MELGTGRPFCLCPFHLTRFDPSLLAVEVSLTQPCHSSCVFSGQSSWKQRGPMGRQLPTRWKSKASPTTTGPHCRAYASSSPANRLSHWVPPSVSSEVGNTQACDTFHIHRRVIAHLLCARRTCGCTKILALAELTFQWGWQGGETGKKVSKAYSGLEANKDMRKENVVWK